MCLQMEADNLKSFNKKFSYKVINFQNDVSICNLEAIKQKTKSPRHLQELRICHSQDVVTLKQTF